MIENFCLQSDHWESYYLWHFHIQKYLHQIYLCHHEWYPSQKRFCRIFINSRRPQWLIRFLLIRFFSDLLHFRKCFSIQTLPPTLHTYSVVPPISHCQKCSSITPTTIHLSLSQFFLLSRKFILCSLLSLVRYALLSELSPFKIAFKLSKLCERTITSFVHSSLFFKRQETKRGMFLSFPFMYNIYCTM